MGGGGGGAAAAPGEPPLLGSAAAAPGLLGVLPPLALLLLLLALLLLLRLLPPALFVLVLMPLSEGRARGGGGGWGTNGEAGPHEEGLFGRELFLLLLLFTGSLAGSCCLTLGPEAALIWLLLLLLLLLLQLSFLPLLLLVMPSNSSSSSGRSQALNRLGFGLGRFWSSKVLGSGSCKVPGHRRGIPDSRSSSSSGRLYLEGTWAFTRRLGGGGTLCGACGLSCGCRKLAARPSRPSIQELPAAPGPALRLRLGNLLLS